MKRLLKISPPLLPCLLLLFSIGCGTPGEDAAFESFSIIMDLLAGSREDWRCESHFAEDGALSVRNLKVRVPGDFLPFFSKEREPRENFLTVDFLRVKGLSAPGPLKRLLRDGVRKGASMARVASELVINGVSDDYSDGDRALFRFRLKSALLKEISISGAPPGDGSLERRGKASSEIKAPLAQSLFIGSARYEGLRASLSEPLSPEGSLSASSILRINSVLATGQGFKEPILGEYGSFEPFGSPSFESLIIRDFDLSRTEPGKGSVDFGIEESEHRGVLNLVNIGESDLKNVSLVLKDRYPYDDFTRIISIALSGASGKGIDLGVIIRSFSYPSFSYPSLVPRVGEIKEGVLADNLSLFGLAASLTNDAYEYVDFAIKRLNLNELRLKNTLPLSPDSYQGSSPDASPDSSPVFLSIIKALKVDLLECEGFEGKVSHSLGEGPPGRITPFLALGMESLLLRDHSFNGEGDARDGNAREGVRADENTKVEKDGDKKVEVEKDAVKKVGNPKTPPLFPKGSPSFSELKIANASFSADMSNIDGAQIDLKLGGLRIIGFKSPWEILEAQLNDFKGAFKIFKPQEEEGELRTLSLGVGDFSLKGADLKDFIRENDSVWRSLKNDRLFALQRLAGLYFLSPLFPFSEPFGLDSASLNGLFVDMEGAFKISLDSGTIEGPFKSRKLGNIRKTLRNLELSLSPDLRSANQSLGGLLKENFGLTTLTLNFEHQSFNDPVTQSHILRLNKLELSGMGELSYEIVVDKATPDLLENLKGELSLGSHNLGPILVSNNLGLLKFTLDYRDRGFIKPFLAYLASKNKAPSPYAYAEKLADSFGLSESGPLAEILPVDKISFLRSALLLFLSDPRSLELSLLPQESLSPSLILPLLSDKGKIPPLLNASFSVNGGERISLTPKEAPEP
jgi:hypothetical protein